MAMKDKPFFKLSDNNVNNIFNTLYSIYGPQFWWPGESQFEIIIGAILTQNTSWQNVAKTIINLKENDLLDPSLLLSADPYYIKELIKPSGFYNIKYKRLRNFLEYLTNYEMDLNRLSFIDTYDLRSKLLNINGIGPETADSILLYAFDRPIFVVDSYTRRLFSRLGYKWMKKASYDDIQIFFMNNLPPVTKLFNEYHALIVQHCKSLCRKQPLCSKCSITDCNVASGRR